MSSSPLVAHSRDELRELLERSGGRVALVPTMGALHAGHVALVECARAVVGSGGTVVVSIFVNPLQFGVGEDLDQYPRTLDADLETCARHGVDVVFAPAVEEMYPDGVSAESEDRRVTVDPGELGTVLEGRIRPTHFRGVLTVVTKLFSLVRPDVALFGEKDYQQLVLVRRLVRDLSLGVEVVGVPTVRDEDGLALSSRNGYLDDDGRWRAAALARTLFAAQRGARHGATAAIDAARHELRHARGVDLEYLELTAPDLGPAPAHGPARLLIAARVGGTRLIDNVALELNGEA